MPRVIACLLALLFTCASRGAEPPGDRGLARDLAEICLAIAGGREAHAALAGLRARGETVVGEQRVAFVLHAARPDRLRVETLGPVGDLVRATDGLHEPWVAVAGGPPRRMPAGEARDFMAEADFDPPYFEPEKRGLTLTHVGSATRSGRTVQLLRLVDRAGQVSLLHVDEGSRWLVRREILRRAGARDHVIATEFDDYQPCAGVMLPRLVRTYVNDRLANETRITELVPNPDLPASLFAPPAADWPLRPLFTPTPPP